MPEDVQSSQRDLVNQAGEIAQLLFASRYDEADPKFEALLKEYPKVPFLHYAYGTALLAISRYQEAKAQMYAEIAISPNSELPYVRLASIALRQQQPGDAIDPAEHAIKLAADSAEAHYLLGRAALGTGDTSHASFTSSRSPAGSLPRVRRHTSTLPRRTQRPDSRRKPSRNVRGLPS